MTSTAATAAVRRAAEHFEALRIPVLPVEYAVSHRASVARVTEHGDGDRLFTESKAHDRRYIAELGRRCREEPIERAGTLVVAMLNAEYAISELERAPVRKKREQATRAFLVHVWTSTPTDRSGLQDRALALLDITSAGKLIAEPLRGTAIPLVEAIERKRVASGSQEPPTLSERDSVFARILVEQPPGVALTSVRLVDLFDERGGDLPSLDPAAFRTQIVPRLKRWGLASAGRRGFHFPPNALARVRFVEGS